MLAARSLELLSRREVARWGRDFDVLLTPTSAILPPKAGSIDRGRSTPRPRQPVFEVVASVSFTAFGNVTGLPAVSLPLHWTDEELPVGVQLTGGPWQEAHADRAGGAARSGAAVGRAPAGGPRRELTPTAATSGARL